MSIDGYRAICTNRACTKGKFGLLEEQKIPSFCPQCGAGVISSCPACNKPITELWDEWSPDPPNHCAICGETLRNDSKADGVSAIRVGE